MISVKSLTVARHPIRVPAARPCHDKRPYQQCGQKRWHQVVGQHDAVVLAACHRGYRDDVEQTGGVVQLRDSGLQGQHLSERQAHGRGYLLLQGP